MGEERNSLFFFFLNFGRKLEQKKNPLFNPRETVKIHWGVHIHRHVGSSWTAEFSAPSMRLLAGNTLRLGFPCENGQTTNSIKAGGLEEAMGVNTDTQGPEISRVLKNVICIWINLQR